VDYGEVLLLIELGAGKKMQDQVSNKRQKVDTGTGEQIAQHFTQKSINYTFF
jgi:hypothetical protein